MKYLNLFILLFMLQSCGKKEGNETPLYKIGEGVEVYKALFIWDSTCCTRTQIRKTIIGEAPPVVNYNELLYFEWKKLNYTSNDKSLLLFTKNDRDKIFTLKPSVLKPDSGYAITLNKEIIYSGYYKVGASSFYDRDVCFFYSPIPNSIIVFWDSLNSRRDKYRNETDPRYDPRLLNRLRQDGKLKE